MPTYIKHNPRHLEGMWLSGEEQEIGTVKGKTSDLPFKISESCRSHCWKHLLQIGHFLKIGWVFTLKKKRLLTKISITGHFPCICELTRYWHSEQCISFHCHMSFTHVYDDQIWKQGYDFSKKRLYYIYRERVIYCCITNYPKYLALKKRISHIVSIGQESCSSSCGKFEPRISHEGAVDMSIRTQSSEGMTEAGGSTSKLTHVTASRKPQFHATLASPPSCLYPHKMAGSFHQSECPRREQ